MSAAALRWTMAIGSLLIAMAIVEAAVRIFHPQQLSGWWMVNHRSGLVLNRAGGQARHAFRDIAVTYSFGPNHNRTLAAAPQTADRRLVLIGDSFTFGWLIADGLTFADKLQTRLRNHEILNVAVGGWGTADHVKYVELFCRAVKPSMIYVVMNSLDAERAAASRLYRLDAGGDVAPGAADGGWAPKFILNKVPGYGWLLEHSHLAQFARAALLSRPARRGAATAPVVSDPAPLMRALFRKLQRDAADCGTRLVVFFTGWWQPTASSASNLTHDFVERARADRFFDTNGIEFHDLSTTAAMADLFRNREKYTIPGDGHPNPAGADLLHRALMEIQSRVTGNRPPRDPGAILSVSTRTVHEIRTR